MIQVTWDAKKCPTPQDCRDCLDVCPQGVFMVHPRDGRKPGKPTENWAITPVFLSLCSGCEICEEICPQDALTVSAVQ